MYPHWEDDARLHYVHQVFNSQNHNKSAESDREEMLDVDCNACYSFLARGKTPERWLNKHEDSLDCNDGYMWIQMEKLLKASGGKETALVGQKHEISKRPSWVVLLYHSRFLILARHQCLIPTMGLLYKIPQLPDLMKMYYIHTHIYAAI